MIIEKSKKGRRIDTYYASGRFEVPISGEYRSADDCNVFNIIIISILYFFLVSIPK